MQLSLFDQKRRNNPWIFGILAASMIFIGSTAYLIRQQSGSFEQLEELTVPVTQDDLTVRISASGTVEPIKSVNVSPKNPGRLVTLLVEQGDEVSEGQTLAVMENLEVQAQKFQAQAELNQAQANLSYQTIGMLGDIEQAEARLAQSIARLAQAKARIPQDISQTQAQLQSAQSRLKLAQQRVKRNQYLLNQGAISQDTYDEAFTEVENAQAAVAELQQRITQLETTRNPEINQLESAIAEAKLALQQRRNTYQDEIAVLEAQVQANNASLKQRQVQYSDTIVTAPFSGIVTQRYAVEGSFVTPTTSASTSASASATSILALAQGLEIVAKVPEVDIGQLQKGQKVEIVADAYPEDIFKGEVKRIAPEAVVEDNVTSFEVRISLLTGKEKLKSKMNVDVTFLGQELADSLVVPTVAIVTQEGQTGVMLLNEQNQPEFKPVTIGLTLQDKTQILQGITSEDKVFIDLPQQYSKRKP
ncbi:MAG: efflux RND transporter periplasmic adaptor subunit [Xenococcaceae cyanobacterium MO_167.B27]|nr:efflux RND transporter periplasmic adaptor subunit [Xenococcaceae cyanobacterium MO_167.B27]